MEKLLQVQALETTFSTDRGDSTVLDDVSFSVHTGETVGIVGESGSGKSVTSLSIMRLLDRNGFITKGKVLFEGRNLTKMSEDELDELRGSRLTMIFQDAQSALNPVFTVGNQLMESMRVHLKLSKKAARERAIAILKQVGLPDAETIMKSYPHTLSGGMQQRVMIAIALSCDPKLLIADEPTTALDVTIQAQIMELLKYLRAEINLALILITHDIGLIAEMADRVLVMYAGQIVEEADVFTLFEQPAHPYTQALMRSVPSIEDAPGHKLESIGGVVPENYMNMKGCRFVDRCPFAVPTCAEDYQALTTLVPKHRVRCHRAVKRELPLAWRAEL